MASGDYRGSATLWSSKHHVVMRATAVSCCGIGKGQQLQGSSNQPQLQMMATAMITANRSRNGISNTAVSEQQRSESKIGSSTARWQQW